MKVDVLQEDIDTAMVDVPWESETASSCPVALAISRAIGAQAEDGRVMVYAQMIEIDGRQFPAPADVASFVSDFDNGLRVTPFSFDVYTEGENRPFQPTKNDLAQLTLALSDDAQRKLSPSASPDSSNISGYK